MGWRDGVALGSTLKAWVRTCMVWKIWFCTVSSTRRRCTMPSRVSVDSEASCSSVSSSGTVSAVAGVVGWAWVGSDASGTSGIRPWPGPALPPPPLLEEENGVKGALDVDPDAEELENGGGKGWWGSTYGLA